MRSIVKPALIQFRSITLSMGLLRFTPAADYDVTADERFLMIQEGDQDSAVPQQINVVLNWFEELKRRVPTGQ